LVEGEEANVFANPQEGIWLEGIHQNKQGRILNSNQPTRVGQAYANQVNQILSSPPKKQPQIATTLNQQGLGHTTSSTQHTTARPTALLESAPWQLPSQQSKSTAPEPMMLQLQEQLGKQQIINTRFDQHINKLEYTTNKIDTNVDQFLDILEENAHSSKATKMHHDMDLILEDEIQHQNGSHKSQRTTKNMACDEVAFPATDHYFLKNGEQQLP
jgi:hypothetical protein